MRFADYFGRAFSAVSASQFPWVKMLRESSVAKFADVSTACTLFSVVTITDEISVDQYWLYSYVLYFMEEFSRPLDCGFF